MPQGRLGPRDGLAFMSSNAVSIGRAALLVVDARRLLDAWLSVAALSFEAAAADPVALDPRIHSARHRPGQAAVAARMRAAARRASPPRTRDPGPLGIQDPYPFRAQPQVDGAVHDALLALEETVGHELNFAGENALIVPGEDIALPNGNPHAAPLANAIDGLRTALAQSAALIAARGSARCSTPASPACRRSWPADPARSPARWCSSTPPTPPSPRSARSSRRWPPRRCRSPAASSRTRAWRRSPARRAEDALRALRVAVATELVVAVRALRLAGQEPVGRRQPGPVGGGLRAAGPGPRRPAAASRRRERARS